jgi:hypothetical protein
MKRPLLALPLLACFLLALVLGNQPEPGAAKPLPRVPKGFFGIVPQTGVTELDARYMKAGGIESIRIGIPWAGVQPTPRSPYDWAGIDATIEIAARAGLRVFPSIGSPPAWATGKETTLPVSSARQRKEWKRFLSAAVARYGPGGDFWTERAPGTGGIGPGPNYEPEPVIARPLPIREWQIWNEANFFYFAYPVSPTKYAKLVKLSSQAIKSVDPRAKVVLAGLFAEPQAKGKKGMPATTYLQRLYDIPGFKAQFDGIDLHPYAVDYQDLERMTEEFHDVAVENRDRPGFYMGELGWGSQNNFQQVAYEQGIRGQVKQLRGSYAYLIENARRLNLKSTYWFSWKDLPGSCTFCDSVGFFRAGPKFKAKPAWHAFVALTGGRARP